MAKKKLEFGKAFEELEQIAEWFEKGDADLEEGLAKFERGLELSAACREKLSEVEGKVKELKAKYIHPDME